MTTPLYTTRIEIPCYTDMWMRGARCGELLKTYRNKSTGTEYAVVLLDATRKRFVCVLDDCKIISCL